MNEAPLFTFALSCESYHLSIATCPRAEQESSDDSETSIPAIGAQHQGDTSSITSAMENVSISSARAARPKRLPSTKGGSKMATPDTTEHSALVSEIGDLYLWDFAAEQFNLIEEEVTVKVVDIGGSAFNRETFAPMFS